MRCTYVGEKSLHGLCCRRVSLAAPLQILHSRDLECGERVLIILLRGWVIHKLNELPEALDERFAGRGEVEDIQQPLVCRAGFEFVDVEGGRERREDGVEELVCAFDIGVDEIGEHGRRRVLGDGKRGLQAVR